MTSIISIGAGKIVGVKTSIFTIFNPEKYDAKVIPTAWQEFFGEARGTEIANTNVFYGVSIPSMAADVPMDYYAGVIVDSDSEVPKGFESYEIPAGDYLAIIHRGPITELASTYQRAYMQELGQSGREMRPAPHLEIYNSQLDPMSAEYEMTIGIPVN